MQKLLFHHEGMQKEECKMKRQLALFGGEAPIPKLAAHWNLEPGGVVCVSAAFGSPTRTFRPLRGLSFFGFGCYKDCAPDGAGRGHWGCCARPLNRPIAECTLQIADWGAHKLRSANCGSPNVEAGAARPLRRAKTHKPRKGHGKRQEASKCGMRNAERGKMNWECTNLPAEASAQAGSRKEL